MTLDEATIRELLDFADEDGVLSFYVGHTPDKAADPQPTAPIEIRNQIKQLKAGLERQDPALVRAVSARIDAAGAELGRLLDPAASGRGRALFLGVASGRTERLHLQIPFRDRVVHHDRPYVRPLVAAYDEGRAAGILNVTRETARLLRWAVGEVEELGVRRFEVEDGVMAHDKSGPSAGNVSHPWQGRNDRDAFHDRLDDNLHRFLKTMVDEAVHEAHDQGWDRLVIAGSPKVRDAAATMAQEADGTRVLVSDQTFEDVAPHRVAEQVWPLLRSVHLDREASLVDSTIERALGGSAAALGLRKVCNALNEGRVAHLLYVDDLQVEGFRSDAGTLHPRVEGPMAQSNATMHREPLFVERLIEKAVATSAAVTPIAHDVAGPLQVHEGIGALLRW
jgi:hypothetical protein